MSPRPGHRHGEIQAAIVAMLRAFAAERKLGKVYVETGFQLGPDTLRGPDVGFVRQERAAALDPAVPWPQGAPDLAVEIVSPSDTAAQMDRKVHQYLGAGAQAVWVVYPDSGRLHLFEPQAKVRILQGHDILEAPSILPGFSVPVERIFE